jgi:hypothetical protein
MAPTPSVKRAAWTLLAYVRREIKRGMGDYYSSVKYFNASRPAALHDELKHFLAVYDPDAKYQGRRRG